MTSAEFENNFVTVVLRCLCSLRNINKWGDQCLFLILKPAFTEKTRFLLVIFKEHCDAHSIAYISCFLRHTALMLFFAICMFSIPTDSPNPFPYTACLYLFFSLALVSDKQTKHRVLSVGSTRAALRDALHCVGSESTCRNCDSPGLGGARWHSTRNAMHVEPTL